MGLVRQNRIQQPTETIYLADNESGSWRPIIGDLRNVGSIELNDVWNPAHLPYAAGGKSLNRERRVANARHHKGTNLLFYDGHSSLKPSQLISVDDWREQRY